MGTRARRLETLGALILICSAGVATASATAEFVEHVAANQVYGEATGVTMRNPLSPAAGNAVDLWIRIAYSYYYTDIAIYYTTDGSVPQGSFGTPSGSTAVLTLAGGQVTFIRNEPQGSLNVDWWKGTLPAGVNTAGRTIKYKVSTWYNGGGPEVFANNYGCADNTCDDPNIPQAVFTYTIAGGGGLPWPGKGAPYADHQVGYPPVYFWKEEGVVGNNYINVQVDQNGTAYDIYYPSAGCVQGMGTKNEGYTDGPDQFPSWLTAGQRGQMNVNQAMGGIRVDGVTYWLSNESASGYTNVTQQYVTDTNVIRTTATLNAASNSILVDQYDFSPKGITFPNDQGGQPNRGIYLKRYLLTNNGSAAKTVQFYFYLDPALNGGDSYDVMYADAARGAMIAYDNTDRMTSASGEYNPTSFSDYQKNKSVYLAASLKLLGSVGGAGGTPAPSSWRDSSSDNSQGWIGLEVLLPVGVTKEIDLTIVGGFDTFAGATGTYTYQIAPVLDWFLAGNMSTMQTTTQTYWTDWLAAGVTADTPDADVDDVFKRGLLATALHLDGKNGGLIAGMHNGAYPFIWPRDAVWAAMTLDRTGHTSEPAEVYRFLRDVAYRANDSWGKGFWYQKYTTDGYIVWSAPQVDETSAVPWGVYFHYLVTGDTTFLNNYYTMVYDAGRASSEDSTIDTRLYYDDSVLLMHGNNLWEDSWDDFLYSNASVERGLRDAASIATVLGHGSDATLFTGRANNIHTGMNARLTWDGENTDISQLGLTYPFYVYAANDSAVAHLADRINGVATDCYGNNHPLMNYSGEWQDLVNRYWADTYWNGGPWFLSTAWYGAYYAARQDVNPGKADIDNHLFRLGLLLDRRGPIGFGAEQVAPSTSLMYPDFVLQAAWPNAWESMSFLVDNVMLFLDYRPDAPNNTIHIAPKLPTAWSTMTFHNLALGTKRVDVTCAETASASTNTFVNLTGGAVAYDTYIRVAAGAHPAMRVTQDGATIAYTYDSATGRVHVTGNLATGVGSTTGVRVQLSMTGDMNCDGVISYADINPFVLAISSEAGYYAQYPNCDRNNADCNNDGVVSYADINPFVRIVSSS